MSNIRKGPLNFNFSRGQEPICPSTSELQHSGYVFVLRENIPGVTQMVFVGCVKRHNSNSFRILYSVNL